MTLFGEVELRIVSAAAAVSWELRFLFAVAGETQGAASARRTRPGAKVRRLTSRSPSEATAGVSDDRFAETRSTETSVRPASASVGPATSVEEPGKRPTAQTSRGLRPPSWCVEFVCQTHPRCLSVK